MPPSPDSERSAFEAVRDGLRRWLDRARERVMSPWTRFRAQPSAQEIAPTVPVWQTEVDRILSALTPALREGWAAANLPGNYSPNDPYIQANLALTKNLLVRIPDEVHTLVVREILTGTSAQETTEQIANRVQDVLTYTGSEDWNGRARTIARTEVNRHFNSSMLAHALLLENKGRLGLTKQWDTRMDGDERAWHHAANNQLRPLNQPFLVGGEALLFPVDPRGSPANVINCFPSWTSVSVRATGFMLRRFSGMLINITTSSGNKLSATSNHPVFTREKGWVPIGSLQPGDYILGCTETRTGTRTVNPHIDNGNISIEEVASLLQLLIGDREGMPSTLVDLYGDIVSEDVDVIRSNDVLKVGRDTEQLYKLRHLSVHGCHCKVCFSCNLSSSFFLKEPDQVCLVSSSNWEPELIEYLNDTLTGYSETMRHSLNGYPFFVHGSYPVTEFGMIPSSSLFSSAIVKTHLFKSLLNLPHGDVQRLRDLSRRQPKFVELTHALHVFDSINVSGSSWHSVSSFSNSYYDDVVYDLSTVDGVFAAEGIVVSNCRCDLRILGGLNQ